MKFDKKSKQDLESSFDFGWLDKPTEKVKEMNVQETNAKFARGYIVKNHYSKTFPDSTKHTFVGYLGDKIAGIITYGMGTTKNQYLSVDEGLKDGEYLEITRVWSADSMPKNTESKLISESMKMLPKQVKLIVTFADPSRGHVGYIYQATNGIYIGQSAGGSMLVTKDGIEKHPRLISMYKKRNEHLRDVSSADIIESLGWKKIDSAKKHKYIYLTGGKKYRKEMLKRLENKILSYPKKVC